MRAVAQNYLFDTRSEAETCREDLYMQGYELSFGWDVQIIHEGGAYRVRLTHLRPDERDDY